ncbi:MAG: N-acetylglucosaminyldiphosphoundecaprenol N-acetyl-beta-D-mannosaminyltransferase [Pseudothermotoga sp.]|nr:N-acetylglucosaminyldiphosphoundecaprenol N-acetyl-beta-D-mannosaminyltransferase [Pseudothermotoga sp.]
MPRWRNWQTRMTQDHVGLHPCGFKSRPRHHGPDISGLIFILEATSLEKFTLFDLTISTPTLIELVEILSRRISNNEKTFVVTANASIIVKTTEDERYKFAVQNADIIVPDGIGVIWALKKIYRRKAVRVTGIDTMMALCDKARASGWKIYLLGAKIDVVEKAARNLTEKFGNIVCGYHHGYFEKEGPLEQIKQAKPDLIFVGMGVPKQEIWIYENFRKTTAKLAMGVGGSFDVISGIKKRAPNFIQRARLEWLYRFLQSPLEKKNVPKDISKFIGLVLSQAKQYKY